jgi:hypothetical protein
MYNGSHLVLKTESNPYTERELVAGADTRYWYKTQWGCLKDDPTLAARHTFSEATLPRGVPLTPVPHARICMEYRSSWPAQEVYAGPMVDTEAKNPQYAFSPGGPGTVMQIDVESQLRRLDQPLTNCQAVLAEDAPLYRNTVAPPTPMNVPAGPQNAANPLTNIMRPGVSDSACRTTADAVATAMSGRWIHNPTRQDTMRFDKPFAPPGVGTGQPRGPRGAAPDPYFA